MLHFEKKFPLFSNIHSHPSVHVQIKLPCFNCAQLFFSFHFLQIFVDVVIYEYIKCQTHIYYSFYSYVHMLWKKSIIVALSAHQLIYAEDITMIMIKYEYFLYTLKCIKSTNRLHFFSSLLFCRVYFFHIENYILCYGRWICMLCVWVWTQCGEFRENKIALKTIAAHKRNG